jgi:hypothetical protein
VAATSVADALSYRFIKLGIIRNQARQIGFVLRKHCYLSTNN